MTVLNMIVQWTTPMLWAVGTLTLLVVAVRWGQQWRAQYGAHTITVLPPPEVDPAEAVTLWSNMVGLLRPRWARRLLGQPHLAFEYAFTQDGLTIRMWVPGTIPVSVINRAITAAWPGAHTTTQPATPPLPDPPSNDRVYTLGGRLHLAKHEAFPLRTDFSTDPLRPLLGALSNLGPHETAVVQILARPATGHRTATARRTARQLRTGRATHPLIQFVDQLTATPPAGRPTTNRTHESWDPQGVLEYAARDRAIVAKQRALQFDTALRYAITTTYPRSTPRPDRRRIHQQLRARAHAIAAATAGYSDHNFYRRHHLHTPTRTLARRRLHRGDLLSVPELAALAHLPDHTTQTHTTATPIPPPPEIPSDGPDVKPIGISTSGTPRPVGLHTADARHHTHILGPTGSGKSELLARLILNDIHAHRGVVVVDPKGDLINDVLDRIPLDAADRVILLDPDTPGPPPVLNPLAGDDPAATVDNLVSIFSRVYASSWGPRTDDLLRSALLTLRLLSDTPTLADVPTLLTDTTFRDHALPRIHDDILKCFWTWYDQLSDASRAQVAAPLMNKLRGLLLRPFVRDTLTGGESTINIDKVLDGGILLARLAKGTLSTDTVHLMGSLIVAHTWQAATRRSQLPHHQRKDASLYLDEFQNFMNLAYPADQMLAESRAYKLSLVLAHHYLGQLRRDLIDGVTTNARNKIIFNANPDDARQLAHHTNPYLTDNDLTHLPRYHIAARLVVNSQDTHAFTAATLKLPPPIPGRADHIRSTRAHTTQPGASTTTLRLDPRRST